MTKKEYEKKTKNLTAPKYENLTKKQKQFYDFDFTGEKEITKLKMQLNELLDLAVKGDYCLLPNQDCNYKTKQGCRLCLQEHLERIVERTK